MAAEQVLGNGNPAGTTFGLSSSEKISFYGVNPVVQAALITTVTTTGASSTTNAYGFTTAAQGDAIVASLNALITMAINLGLCASA